MIRAVLLCLVVFASGCTSDDAAPRDGPEARAGPAVATPGSVDGNADPPGSPALDDLRLLDCSQMTIVQSLPGAVFPYDPPPDWKPDDYRPDVRLLTEVQDCEGVALPEGQYVEDVVLCITDHTDVFPPSDAWDEGYNLEMTVPTVVSADSGRLVDHRLGKDLDARLRHSTLDLGEPNPGSRSTAICDVDTGSVSIEMTSAATSMTAGAAGSMALGAISFKAVSSLFTRLPAREALKHPRRRALRAYIEEHPGATFRELVRETDIPAGTCRHHLSVLQRSQVIVEHRHRSTVRFFENHGKFDGSWQSVVLLREPELRRVHDWLRGHPQAIQKDLLDHADSAWGWSRSTTQHRLKRLVDEGLVDVMQIGRRKEYSVATPDQPRRPAFGTAGFGD